MNEATVSREATVSLIPVRDEGSGSVNKSASPVPEVSTLSLVLAACALWLLRFLRRSSRRSIGR